jgi:hypothetical protein
MKNYINEIYGKLTVIEHVTNKKHKRGMLLLCRCECGNIIEKVSADLAHVRKYNTNASCGCATEKDYTGQKFGKLTALYKVRNDIGKGVIWNFLCECGNEVEKIGSPIARNEGALHCGCSPGYFSKTKNEIGNRYGKLVVIENNGLDNKQRALWKCQCDCGNIIIHQGARLRRGAKTHCGCVKPDLSKSNKWAGYGEIPISYYSRVKANASKRKIPFNISIEDMWNKYIEQAGCCALSGQVMVPPTNKNNKMKTKASLDRIDSNKGYTIDNIQWVTGIINIIKADLEEKYFVELCRKISDYRT